MTQPHGACEGLPSNHVLRLLRSLADEVPIQRFTDAVTRLRETGGSETDEMVQLAAHIRETLSERRRREVEFAALEETAADLASIRDIRAVLYAIVKRARRLIGTDASYLTLVEGEDQGRLYTRVTDGISGHSFRDMPAIGIGNLVLNTASPHTTSDYFADRRFDHGKGTDAVVAEEGLVAILAVPVMLGDKVIGILSAADRRMRNFEANETTLLAALAVHAGLAIENARLLESATEAMQRLREATEQARLRSHEAERAAAVHERLTRIVLEGGGVDEVVAATAEESDRHLEVQDCDGRVLASAGNSRGLHVEEDLPSRWSTSIAAGAEYLGVLLADGPPPDRAEVRVLERAAQVTALLLLQRRIVFEAEQRTRGELLRDILAATATDVDAVVERARLFGMDLRMPHLVAVARVEGVRRERVLAACAALQSRFSGLIAEHEGDLVLILSDDRSIGVRGAATIFLAELRNRVSAAVTAVVAGPARGVDGIAAAYRDGRRCFTLMRAMGRTGEVLQAADLGVYGLLLSTAAPSDIDLFVEAQIGPLLEHDATHGSALASTLAAWFASSRNMTATAQALHIHVNTLYQRFERVDNVLGSHWRDPEGALHTQLALRIHELRRGSRGGSV